MTVAFELTLDDVLRAHRRLARQSRGRRKQLTVLAILLLFVLAASVASVSSFVDALLLTSGLALLLGFVVFGLIPFLQQRRVRRDFMQYPQFRGTVSYNLTPEFVTFTTPSSELRLPWDTFTSAAEDEALVFLDVDAVASYFMPKRALSSEQLDALRRLIDTAMGSRTKRSIGGRLPSNAV